jgi:transposase
MADGIRWVGLDVHARQSTVAVFDQATGEVSTRRLTGRPHELLPVLLEIPRPARMVYEAGPTGYGLARRALAEGIELAVCAPSKIERPTDRVKTDQRDAVRLARLLAAGELVLVTIPSVEREQLRDLVRCREDIRVDLVRARHRIGNFLLRREIYWEGSGEAWTRKHRSWLTSIRFADHASQATLADYLHAHDVLIARRDQVENDLSKLAFSAPCAHTVARLRCLRGIDTLSALGLCAEIGEWERFDHPDQLSAYLGIVPLRAHHRPATSARVDHQSRLDPRSPALGRGRLPLPPRPRRRRSARAPPTRPRTRDHQHLLKKRNAGCTPAGANSKTRGANPAESSRSRSPANSPPTAGRSPPAPPHHPNQYPHQPPARGSPTHANPTTRCGWRGGPSHPGSRTQLRDSSPEHPPSGGRARP